MMRRVYNWLVAMVYIFGSLFLDAMYLNDLQIGYIQVFTVFATVLILAEHYSMLRLVQKNFGLSKVVLGILIIFDLWRCLKLYDTITTISANENTPIVIQSVIVVVQLMMLAFRLLFIICGQEKAKVYDTIFRWIIVVFHICSILFLEVLCAVAILWNESVWEKVLCVFMAVIILGEHYLMLHLAYRTMIVSQRTLSIITVFDLIISTIVVLIALLFNITLGKITMGDILFTVMLQILIFSSRIYSIKVMNKG